VKRTGLRLAVNQCARTIQGFQTVFDLRDRGVLGTPYYIRAEYLHGSMRQHFEAQKTWRNQEQTTLGGSSHSIDLILGLMNAPPESVCAGGSKHMFDERTRMNDMDNVLIRFPGGRTGYSVASLGCWRRGLGMAFELYGTKQDVIQTITFDETSDRAGLRFYDGSGAKTVCKFSNTQMEIELGHGQGFYRQQENLLYAIEHDTKQRTMADVVDGARTVATGLAGDESLRTGKMVAVRQWEPLVYRGKAPMWNLDDYQKDLLRAFVPVMSGESRKRILSTPDALDRTREER
jgi:predicted dehydrogenase